MGGIGMMDFDWLLGVILCPICSTGIFYRGRGNPDFSEMGGILNRDGRDWSDGL